MTRARPVTPRYGTASLADLLPAVLARLTGGEASLALPPSLTDHVVVLVLDGLGWRQLQDHADVAPLLSSLPGGPIDTVLPSTTVTALTSLGTGVPPGSHGVLGTTVPLPEELADPDDPAPPPVGPQLDVLHWTVRRRGERVDARDRIVPEAFQPIPTVFTAAAEAGVRTTTVLRPEFVGSGLTRAALRGGATTALADDLTATLGAAVAWARGAGPSLVYAHHGRIDTAGHLSGPGTDPWLASLVEVDTALQRLAAWLPPDVTVLVTADHGMVAVPDDSLVELDDEPELVAGIRALAGEPRARHLACLPGAAPDVLATWRGRLGDDFVVLDREAAAASGWFGPIADHARPRLGDVVAVAATGPAGVVHRRVDPYGGRLPGMHAGQTPAEVEVPLLALNATA